jgi:hypothetical protein
LSFVTALFAVGFPVAAHAEDPPPPAEVPPVAEVDLEALTARLAALEKQVADQQQAIAQQRLAAIPKKDLEFDLEGYYRVRAYMFNHTFAGQTTGPDDDPDYQDARIMLHRLRLQPKITYKQLAKFYFQVDALDDVAWGDNQSLASTSLFAGDPSNTNRDGLPEDTLSLSRAWAEITIPVGSIRAGRMSSHWGMGLLANGGDGFDDTFGENHYGNSFDRVMFATRPIAVARALTGKPDNNIPFFTAIAVDRLVEDPLFQFHGYQCEPGLRADDDTSGYDPRCDANGDGLTDRDHGYVDDERVSEDRTNDWWLDQDDDVMEIVYVAVYRGEKKRYLGGVGDLTAGAYFINRVQRETESNVWISDAYINAKNRGVHFEFEGVTISGKTRAIALPGAVDPTGEGDPLLKKAGIAGYTGRLGYEQKGWAVTFEHGYASGDDNVADANFTGRPLHADHNVGLLLYEEVLARATAETWGTGAQGLWSQGGVYNSRYIFPNAHLYPLDNYEIEVAYLKAWPDRPDGAVIQCDGDDNGCSGAATKNSLGFEIDAAFKLKWHEHALFALEAGYAHATDRIALDAVGLDPGGKFFTVQSRLAYQF